MQVLAQLDAIDAIVQLKARYFRCVDTKDIDGLRRIFTEDAVFDAREGHGDDAEYLKREGCLVGRESILGLFDALFLEPQPAVFSVHHGHTPEITVHSDERASGIWALEDTIRWPSAMKNVASFHGFGHYRDEYCRVDGGWLIRRSVLSRLRHEPI